jgi:outer membrane protein assembly factor BamD (BamD/ComL family)
MSVTGIASSILSILSGSQTLQTPFQRTRSEFQQLGQDLQAGNLAQAQQDFAALSQNLPSANQNSTNPVAQAITQLGKDLQSGNLQAAQQDFTTIREDSTQQLNVSPVQIHHLHHHHVESQQDSSSGQQTNSIAQDFSKLAESLQAGNLQSAQQAFSTLQTDLQQIGGFITPGPSGINSTAVPATAGSLNVTV